MSPGFSALTLATSARSDSICAFFSSVTWPSAAAKALKTPLLILQGERDFQVTMDNFEAWKKALAGRPGVTFKTYPKLNHLFIEGEGKSTPADYEKPGHVAEAVIAEIAGWIKK